LECVEIITIIEIYIAPYGRNISDP